MSSKTNNDNRDERRKVILNFRPESLDALDAWRTDHGYRGTRTDLLRDSLELFTWLWEAHKNGSKILVQKSDESLEEVTRLVRGRFD